jgi:hypothetical protein
MTVAKFTAYQHKKRSNNEPLQLMELAMTFLPRVIKTPHRWLPGPLAGQPPGVESQVDDSLACPVKTETNQRVSAQNRR